MRRDLLARRVRRSKWLAMTLAGLAAVSLLLGSSGAEALTTAGSLSVKPGQTKVASDGPTLQNGIAEATFGVTKPSGPGSLYLGLKVRDQLNGTAYVAKSRIFSTGAVNIGLSKTVGGKETVMTSYRVPDLHVTSPTQIKVAIAVGGTKVTGLKAKVWAAGAAQPTSWQVTQTDTGPGVLSQTGKATPFAYLSTSATTPTDVSFYGLTTTASAATSGPSVTLPSPAASTSTSTPASSPTPTPSHTLSHTPSPTPTQAEVANPAPTTPATAVTEEPASTTPATPRVGVPQGQKLKVYDGDLVVRQAGAVYDSLDIHGFVNIEAPDVTITNSIIRGRVTRESRGVVNVTNANAARFVLRDSTIQPTTPQITVDGIDGGNFTLDRVEIDGGVDNAHVFKSDVKINSSWLHGTDFFATGANQGGKTHNDGVQVMGGTNISISYTRIEGADNAAIMVTQDASAVSNLNINDNYLNNGGCTVNIVEKGLPTIGPIYMYDNVFGGSTRIANCPVARTHATTLIASGNVSVDGAAARINVWN